MPIDDPIGAVKQQFEDEERSSDPVLPYVAKLVDKLADTVPPIGKILGSVSGPFLSHLEDDRNAKRDLLIDTIIQELRRLDKRIDEMAKTSSSPAQQQERRTQWFPLVVDGLKRAENTRDAERVRRLGLILANAAVAIPVVAPDETEEMMRTAVELSDRDVQFLRDLVKVQGEIVANQGRIERFSAWMSWPKGPWQERVDPELDSVFSKLESFGLVVRLAPPTNMNIQADFQTRYALLKKGLDFSNFIRRNAQ